MLFNTLLRATLMLPISKKKGLKPLPLQVNYFPSRFDPVRHAERFPENRMHISGTRERRMIDKVCCSSFCSVAGERARIRYTASFSANLLEIILSQPCTGHAGEQLQAARRQVPQFRPCSQGEACEAPVRGRGRPAVHQGTTGTHTPTSSHH